MGSSGGSITGNPAYLSVGNTPIPNIPIAGQGTSDPHSVGTFQNFLPDIPAAGQGSAPLAKGLTAEMFNFRAPSGGTATSGTGSTTSTSTATSDSNGSTGTSSTGTSSTGTGSTSTSGEIDSLRQQVAALQAQAGNGQYGAARSGQYGQQSTQSMPANWINSNNPYATS